MHSETCHGSTTGDGSSRDGGVDDVESKVKRIKLMKPVKVSHPSKMDLLGVGAVGSKVVQFLSLKDGTSLAKCSKHCRNVVEHPSSWPPAITITKNAMMRCVYTPGRIDHTLNRSSLQRLTLDISGYTGWNGPIVSFVENLSKLANGYQRSNSHCNWILCKQTFELADTLKELTIVCSQSNQTNLSTLLNSLKFWAPNLQTLRIVRHFPLIDERWFWGPQYDSSYELKKLHTLDLSNFETFVHTHSLLNQLSSVRILSVFFSAADFLNSTNHRVLSHMPLTQLTIRSMEGGPRHYDTFFDSLHGPIVESLESLGETNAWSLSIVDKFPNLRQVRVFSCDQAIAMIDKIDKTNKLVPTGGVSKHCKITRLIVVDINRSEFDKRVTIPVTSDGSRSLRIEFE